MAEDNKVSKAHTKTTGESVNAFMVRAVTETIHRENTNNLSAK